jgi:hypothetical protein
MLVSAPYQYTMSPYTNTQLPPFHNPLLQHVNHAYYHLHIKASLVGLHSSQLQAYLLFDQALRDDYYSFIQPFRYKQFAALYNQHPNTTENWAMTDNAGAVQVSNLPIMHS